MSGCETYEKGGGVVLLDIAITRKQSFHNKNLSYEIREIMFWRLNDSEHTVDNGCSCDIQHLQNE